MSPTATDISSAMSDFYIGQIVDIVPLLVFIVIVGVITFFAVKSSEEKMMNKILISVFVAVIVIGGVIVSAVRFVPVHKDYTEQSYIIETDAEIFVHEQSATNFFDYYDDIEITTSSGEKIMLKLYMSNSLEKNRAYRGTFVYTTNYKTIIWYDIASE